MVVWTPHVRLKSWSRICAVAPSGSEIYQYDPMAKDDLFDKFKEHMLTLES